VEGEVGEGVEFEEVLAGWRLIDRFVFENPGEVVGDEDGVEARAESGVDVGARAVADHPGGAGLAAMMGAEGAVGLGMLFGEDFDGGEVRGEAGAAELASLLFRVALGDEDEAVAGGEFGEGRGYVGEEFDLLVGDGLGEALDALVLFGGDGVVGELFEAGDEGMTEAVEAVAVGGDGGVLDAVEMLAHLFGGVGAVVEVGDEGGDGSLEVDVVLPESVVCIDEEGLGSGAADGLALDGHGVIIRLDYRVGHATGGGMGE
jgi:hypothetical protein